MHLVHDVFSSLEYPTPPNQYQQAEDNQLPGGRIPWIKIIIQYILMQVDHHIGQAMTGNRYVSAFEVLH